MKERFKLWEPECAEYFEHFADGRYDGAGHLWFIFRAADVFARPDKGDLVVGSAGADGIDFCFRRGKQGVWAYYPIDDEYVLLASTLQDLARGWLSGSLKV